MQIQKQCPHRPLLVEREYTGSETFDSEFSTFTYATKSVKRMWKIFTFKF